MDEMKRYCIIVSLALLTLTIASHNLYGKNEQKGYTHGWWKAGQSADTDDRVQLCHGHLFRPLHSLDHLLLMLQNGADKVGRYGTVAALAACVNGVNGERSHVLTSCERKGMTCAQMVFSLLAISV